MYICKIKNYIRNQKISRLVIFIFILLLVITYGYSIMNPAISIDDVTYDYYFLNGGILFQKRFFPFLLNKLFPIYNFVYIIPELLGVITMMIGLYLFSCVIAIEMSDDCKNIRVYQYIFMGVAAFYPQIREYYGYSQNILSAGIAFTLVALAFITSYDYVFDNKGKKSIFRFM